MDFNVAVIGNGDMGTAHANAWAARDDATVVSVYDPDTPRAEKLAEAVGANVCGSEIEAIEAEGVNVVSVCTPACRHSQIAVQAAERGRHVLTEKPIALTLEQADAMIAAAAANDVKLGVSFQYRGGGHNRQIRRAFQRGDFAGPVMARFTDVRDVRPKLAMHSKTGNGGPVIDMIGHFLDLMRWFTGAEPVSVASAGHTFGADNPRLASVEDVALDAAEILVRFTDGHVCSILVNWGMPDGFGAIGGALLIGPKLAVQVEGASVVARYPDHNERWDEFRSPLSGPAVRIDDLVQAIRNDTRPEVAGEDGRAALRVSLAALEAIETGGIIEI